jgi:peptidoglycan LD-endopeptidase LytH
MKRPRKRHLLLLVLLAWLLAPEWPRIPVQGASSKDWHRQTFWFEPWGRSGVHKGIDIFGRRGTRWWRQPTAWCCFAARSRWAAR